MDIDSKAAVLVRSGICPDCGFKLEWGPAIRTNVGILAQNAACPKCRQRYNVPVAPFSVQRYGKIKFDFEGNIKW